MKSHLTQNTKHECIHPWCADKAHAITLSENITVEWNADAIAKKKNEENGFGPIVGDDISGDNSKSDGGGEKRIMMIRNWMPKIWSKEGGLKMDKAS